ncbi:P-loop containing nucleoside triphosphate hydrolase protein [Fusarium oxysporum f. sp. albedinis]|nr:P-loop containing nucleoside triphosphate hydrolase protein [Fusarium oxysporum f. sp. albedinis]
MERTNAIRRKLVIIGDSACGKTSLLSMFTLGNFPAVPTVFENYITNCIVDGQAVEFALWDTAGLEDYARLRPLAYSNANIILIGFSVEDLCSLNNVKCKEATRLCPGVPVVLVGLKKDLREDPTTTRKIGENSLRFVTEHEGEIVAYEIGAKMYLECSSLSGEGVDTVFEIASRIALLAVRKVTGEGYCPIL